MLGIRIAVNPVDEIDLRCAYALAGHPGVAAVGLIGKAPPASWKERIARIESADGFDIVVSGTHPETIGVFRGEATGHQPGISHASVAGLARALLSRVENGVPVVALPGQQSGEGQLVRLPEPVGDVRIDGDFAGVPMGRCRAPWAAAAAFSLTRTMAVIDDHRFLAAACLAAAALLARNVNETVWERPNEYLASCEDFGLVVAEATQPG